MRRDWPWWRKGPSDAFGTWREWTRSGRVALLDDHAVSRYAELLEAQSGERTTEGEWAELLRRANRRPTNHGI
jgi:hypothetical protein